MSDLGDDAPSPAQKAARTKGPLEHVRAGLMAGWTKRNGKDDERNPYARENFDGPDSGQSQTESDPEDTAELEDARKRILREIIARQGQGAFRDRLVREYQFTCALTGCMEVDALEAAHIIPYLGPSTNAVSNGILLRADLHTLLDKGLLSFDLDYWPPRAAISSKVNDPSYRALHGAAFRLPMDSRSAPDREAMRKHRTLCGW